MTKNENDTYKIEPKNNHIIDILRSQNTQSPTNIAAYITVPLIIDIVKSSFISMDKSIVIGAAIPPKISTIGEIAKIVYSRYTHKQTHPT